MSHTSTSRPFTKPKESITASSVPPPLLLHPSTDKKKTLTLIGNHAAMRRLSIQEDIPTDFCAVQSSSRTPRYDKRYLNRLLNIFTVLRVFMSRCFWEASPCCCRDKEPVRPVCTLHIISKPKHITACLEGRACKEKILTFTLTAPNQQS